ncbi:hypothetical protein U1Q18_019534 [Sarracenia purpurea var. burkii]
MVWLPCLVWSGAWLPCLDLACCNALKLCDMPMFCCCSYLAWVPCSVAGPMCHALLLCSADAPTRSATDAPTWVSAATTMCLGDMFCYCSYSLISPIALLLPFWSCLGALSRLEVGFCWRWSVIVYVVVLELGFFSGLIMGCCYLLLNLLLFVVVTCCCFGGGCLVAVMERIWWAAVICCCYLGALLLLFLLRIDYGLLLFVAVTWVPCCLVFLFWA